MKSLKPAGTANLKPKVLATLDYVSPSDLRTSYLTGLFAAPTPEGSINVVGYVERKGFPEKAELTAAPDGTGGMMEDIGKMGWVREIHNSFLINIPAAEALIEVLQESIDEIKDRQKRISTDNNKRK